jgi:hypothetical protein
MVMMERFGSPASRIMSVMKSFQIPVRSLQPGDKLLVITDDAMDPLVWQCMMAAINEKAARRYCACGRGCRVTSPTRRKWRSRQPGAPT